jgi:hypothetical protein
VIFDSAWDGHLESTPQAILNMNLYPFKWSFDPRDSIDGSTIETVQGYYTQAIYPYSNFISIHNDASALFTPSLLSFIKTTADSQNVSIVPIDKCTKVKRFWDDCTFNASLSDVKYISNNVLFATSVPKTTGTSSQLIWFGCLPLLFSINLL